TGYFESSLTLSFYPPPPGGPVPPEPSKVVPIWTKYVQASLPVVSATATVPRNASAASLELWSYGFGSTGGDEFWWASAAPARSVDLSLDGTPFVAAYPFPSLNTGGVDLFLWRPLPAAYTLSYRPQTINLTGALGAIDGTHTYNVTIGNRHATDPWWTAGTLLLWTDPNVSGAALVSSGATWPSPMNSGTTVTSATSFHFSSTLTTSAGPVGVATQGSGTFRETEVSTVGGMNGTSWTNISQSSGLATQTTVTGPNGTAFANSTRKFTFSTDLGSRFVESSNTGGGYPIEGNATIFMLNFQQEWTELATWATVPAGGPRVSSSETIDNEVSGANGIFSTEEKLTSATASPQVLAYTLIQSATPKYTAELRNDATGTSGYARVLTGSDYQPTDPNLSETILENRLTTVPAPLGVVVTTTPDPVDLGQTVTLSAIARGGAGVYGYSWSGLPPGCGPSASAFVTCAPSLPGTYAPVAVVTDSSGASAPSAGGLVVVAPRLGATLVASAPGSDVGLALSFAVAISGGVPPFACSWSVGGTPSTAPCNQSVPATTSVAGSIVATVFVTDGTGALVNATSPAIPIHDALIALLQPVDPTAHARVGVASNYTVAVEGGTAPVALTWYLGDSVLPGFNGTSLSFVPDKTGNLSISVRAVDAAGGATRSNALTVPVAGAASSNTTGPNPGSSSSSETVFWVAVGLAALAGVEAIFLLARYLPPKPPSRQG
ncbi:MAG TPA: peptide-N4-asparagine amidase, partial [Thermoplasmata archaeon]|nr:peptide-N4-asparagine amidase [Thermoplasmata archaeon]